MRPYFVQLRGLLEVEDRGAEILWVSVAGMLHLQEHVVRLRIPGSFARHALSVILVIPRPERLPHCA